MNNISSFHKCTFIVNDVSRFGDLTATVGISMCEVKGIAIRGCIFNYTAPSVQHDQRGSGIVSILSTFRIGNYDGQRTTFQNLNRAIDAAGPVTGFMPIIDNARFIDNRYGVLLSGFGLSRITRNDFTWHAITDPGNIPTYGVYLQECQGYTVTENNFDGNDGVDTYGVVVNKSGNAVTEIYKNTFKNSVVSSMVYGDNRNENLDNVGLQWLCNEYGDAVDPDAGNYYNIGLYGTINGQPTSMGAFQGTNPNISTGNKLYPDCDPDFDTDSRELKLQEQNPASYYSYVHDQPFWSEPLCHSEGIQLINTGDFSQSSACPSKLNSGKTPSDYAAVINYHKNLKTQLQVAYDGTVNNGTGDYLRTILDNPSSTSMEIRNAFLDASPDVSDFFLTWVLQRQPALEGWHMAQVLLANSPLRAGVLAELSRSDFYPFYIALVEAGQTGGLSNLHIMEMDYADAITGFYTNLDDYLQSELEMEDDVDNWLRVQNIVDDYKQNIPIHRQAMIEISRGDYIAASNLLENCDGKDEKLCEALDAVIKIHKEGMAKDGFKGSVIQILQNTSESNGHPMQETSEKLLEFWGIGNHEEFLATPDANGYRSVRTKLSDLVEVKTLAIYPNPASDKAFINYLLPEGWENASINVYDQMGRQLNNYNLAMYNGIIEIDLNLLTSGIYSVELVVDKINFSTAKLSVIH